MRWIPILRLEFHPSKNKVQRVGLSSHPQFHARMPVRDGKLFVRWGKMPVRDGKLPVRWGKTHVRWG